MLLRFLAFFVSAALCLAADVPRPLLDVPILYPNGQKLNFKTKYRGRVIVVVLISTGCKDCSIIVEELGKLQRSMGPRGLVVVGAAIDDDAKFAIAPWVGRYRPPFEMGYLDRDSAIKLASMKQTGNVVPIMMFIDKKSQVRFQTNGDDPIMKERQKALPAIIDSLLKDMQGPLSTTKQVGPDGKELPPPPAKK